MSGSLASLDRQQLTLVADTALAIAKADQLDAALQALIRGAAGLTGAERGGVRFLTPSDSPSAPSELFFWEGGDVFTWRPPRGLPGADTRSVLEHGHPIYTADLAVLVEAGDAGATVAVQQDRLRSSLIVPLRADGRVIGTLHADSYRPDAFAEELLVPLQVLADHAGEAVGRTRARQAASARLRRLEVIARVSKAVSAAGDLNDLLRQVLEAVSEVLGIRRMQIALVDLDGRHVRGRVGLGLQPGLVETTVRRLYPEPDPAEDIYALVVRTGEQLVADDSHPALHRPTMERFALTSQYRILTPIAYAGDVVGVLTGVLGGEPPSAEDLAVLRVVAEQAGGAIARARLAEAERQARVDLAIALESSQAVVFTYDTTGQVTTILGNTIALLGWPAGDLIGQRSIGFIHPDDRATSVARLASRQDGAASVPYETRLLHRDGRAVPVLVTAGTRRNESGEIVGGGGVLVDRSALMQVAAERDQAMADRARLEGAIRTGRTVAHELAGPLGGVGLLLDLVLASADLPAALAADLRTVSGELERAAELLGRFRAIGRYAEEETPFGPQLSLERVNTGDKGG